MKLGIFALTAAGLLAAGGSASAQVVVVPAGPPPVVAVPAYTPGVAVGGTINLPGVSVGGYIAPRPPVVVAPVVPLYRPGFYPVFPRPYHYGPYHHGHHHW